MIDGYEHETNPFSALRLPAVSGSSGRLLISAPATETATRSVLGQVFADESLAYTEAMLQFVAASPNVTGLEPVTGQTAVADERSSRKAQKQARLREADELRLARHQQREQRKIEDHAWQALRAQLRSKAPADTTAPALSRAAAAKRKHSLRAPRSTARL